MPLKHALQRQRFLCRHVGCGMACGEVNKNSSDGEFKLGILVFFESDTIVCAIV